jgi:HK97 family phage prohead protease
MNKMYRYAPIGTIAGVAAFKDINMSKREIVSQFSSYDVIDSYGDITMKGAFNRSVNNNFKRIKHLMNHDTTQVPGVPVEIWEDDKGAYLKSKIGTHTLGKDFLEMADSGIITEHSYGYGVVREEKSMVDDQNVNLLHEVKLWEVSSLSAWGANEFTPLISLSKAQRSEKLDQMVKRMNLLEKFCKNSGATDDTIELLLIEIKQLQSLVAETITTDSVEETTPPVVEDTQAKNLDEALARIKLLELKLN